MTKLAIFDLDGTLLNTVEDLGNATNYALTQCGFPIHPTDAYYQMVGRGIYNLFRAAIPSEYATEGNVQRMARSSTKVTALESLTAYSKVMRVTSSASNTTGALIVTIEGVAAFATKFIPPAFLEKVETDK